MMSLLPTKPTPPPRQNPCTADTTGTAHSYTAANAAKHPRFARTSASNPDVVCISLMSTPALKPRPSARKMTTRTDGSRPRPVTVSASSNHCAAVSALTGGQSMTTSATPSSSMAASIPILQKVVGR
jgi:hypothetical protein